MNKTHLLPRLVISAITALAIGACNTIPPKDGGTMGHIQASMSETQVQVAPPSPPPEVSAALLPPINVGNPYGGGQYNENRFDISVTESAAQEFFMGLVDGSAYNMVVHPEVDGNISLSLKNVTILDVMETLRQVYGYEYNLTASGFQVMPARMQSRIYQVNYLNIKRSGSSNTRVSSGQVSEVSSGGDDGGGSSQSSGSISGSEIKTQSESDFWAELRSALTTIVGGGQGRSVVVTPQSGLVIVRAMPSELRDVEHYLNTTDEAMHRQVILEAKILEVELNDGYQAGISWSKIVNNGNNSLSLGQSGGGLFTSSNDVAGIRLPNGGISNPSTGSGVGFMDFTSFGGFFGGVLNTGSFLAFIELLENQGNVQVLSSPRVSTLNNQKAVIKVGTDEFFVTDISSTTSGSGSDAITTPDITLTPFFSGIALDVTPQIDSQGGVTLHVHPSVSNVTDQQKEIQVGSQVQSLPLAHSTVRESDSIVYAQSGQLIVIGGLMQNKVSEQLASTPFLGDLPLLGQMFRRTQQGSVKSELVILIRPTVVESGQAWKSSLQKSSNRFKKLDRGFHYGSRSDVFGNKAERRSQ